ncbi:hypothetical protein, partial [Plasmodium yoelii yoelii]
MFLYLMKVLFSKTYDLYHIYFDSNRMFITEHCYSLFVFPLH